jgi:hypothetical protein
MVTYLLTGENKTVETVIVFKEVNGAILDDDLLIKSRIYHGKNKDGSNLKEYEKAVNKASYDIVKANPAILVKRKELMTQAQANVRDTYHFKKGFSRSKVSDPASKEVHTEPKKVKTFKEERDIKMKELRDQLSEIKKMVSFKMSRRDKCASVKEWKTCETISTEIRKLLSQKGEIERELLILERKENKSQWYSKRKALEIDENKEERVKKPKSTSTTTTQDKGSTVDIRSAFRIEKDGSDTSKVVMSTVETATTKAIASATQSLVVSSVVSSECITSKVQIECDGATKRKCDDASTLVIEDQTAENSVLCQPKSQDF